MPTLVKIYQFTTKCTNLPQNIPNYHKMFQFATKGTNLPQNVPICHKMYQFATKCTSLPQNVPNYYKMYQFATKYIYQMSLKYTNICHCKAPPQIYSICYSWSENVHTIWQPCGPPLFIASPPPQIRKEKLLPTKFKSLIGDFKFTLSPDTDFFWITDKTSVDNKAINSRLNVFLVPR
jgi:hypothetical protein